MKRALLLTLAMACLGVVHGCGGRDMGASGKVLRSISLPKGTATFQVEEGALGDGAAVYFLQWDLAYWVLGETVYAANERARELAPDLPPAPEDISYEAVYDASGDGDHVKLGQRATRIYFEGWKLSEEKVKELENALDTRPDDLWARTMLLGYHGYQKYDLAEAMGKYEEHVLWLAENAPASPVMGSVMVDLHPELNPVAYPKVAALMRGHLEKDPGDLSLLSNAADFFLRSDRSFAEECLKKCAEIEPDNPHWPRQLGFLYSLPKEADESSPVETAPDSETARKALAALERAAELTTEPEEKILLLTELAEMAFAAGELEKAHGYATALLTGNDGPEKWNRGNRIHTGNTVLGRIALAGGDVEKAKGHLIEAGKCGGSPQLDSFGPDMTLANELLQRGETDAVAEYLGLCGGFWKRGATERRIAAIQRGEKPVLDRRRQE